MSTSNVIFTGRYTPPSEESGKTRILEILKLHAKPNGWISNFTVPDVAKAVGLDIHEVVSLLHSMKNSGHVTFRERSGKEPVRLRLTPPAMGKSYSKNTLGTPWARARNLKITIDEPLLEEPSPPVEELDNPWVKVEDYPIIRGLIARRHKLLAAAKLAEEGNADDIALALIEKAEMPLSPLEEEAIRLYKNTKE